MTADVQDLFFSLNYFKNFTLFFTFFLRNVVYEINMKLYNYVYFLNESYTLIYGRYSNSL